MEVNAEKPIWVRPGVQYWKTPDSWYLGDSLTKKTIRINGTAFLILSLCNGKTRLEISDEMKNFFSENDIVSLDTQIFLDKLFKEGFIIHSSPNELIESLFNNEYPLGLVFCELTHACNFHCRTCYNNSGSPQKNELTTNEWKCTLKKIAAIAKNPEKKPTLILTGGEPLLRRDFLEIASFAKEIGLTVQLFTNGSLIDDNMADEIARLNLDYVRISVDGSNEVTSDYIRGAGNFQKAIAAMKRLRDRNVKVCWQSVITNNNFHELDEMLFKAIALNLDGFRVSSIDPVGRGEEIRSSSLSPEKELELWRFLTNSTLLYGKKIKIGAGADYCIEIDWVQEILVPKIFKNTDDQASRINTLNFITTSMCGIGRKSFLVTPEGYIALCPMLSGPEFHMGHVIKDNLEDIWKNGKFFQTLRQNQWEDYDNCKSCGFRYSCQGGCRALAFRINGSLTSCDPKRLAGLMQFANTFSPPEM